MNHIPETKQKEWCQLLALDPQANMLKIYYFAIDRGNNFAQRFLFCFS